MTSRLNPLLVSSMVRSIAHATEARFRLDRDQGLRHLVMVRADTITRAKELHELHEKTTRLNLAFVNGRHTLVHVRRIIERLRQGKLDGTVCVNMLGEGFNLHLTLASR